MSQEVVELFGMCANQAAPTDWAATVRSKQCPYLVRKCLKVRKSRPDIAIGTCTVSYGADARDIIICPHRLLERRQIFSDCLQLLTLHEPGNEYHVIAELAVPGGSVDYCLASVRDGKVCDFVGIELQTLDTTGTVWPARQRFLKAKGVSARVSKADSKKRFGMNWKMTAKTSLLQLHHKVATFENIGKHVVLVLQDHLLAYMQQEFFFDHLSQARSGDAMHFHSYGLKQKANEMRLGLSERLSTDSAGIARCLGLQAEARVHLEEITALIESKLSERTLYTL